ncbi:MAG: SpoVA/SpoVAEb family sporulation membrane protein [Bacteroidota bacterium]
MPNDVKDQRAYYQRLVKANTPKAPVLVHVLAAFFVGGLLSLLGQGFLYLFMSLGLPAEKATSPTLAAMIFIGAVATAFGVYDRLGEFAGAGAAIPITGFANSIVSAAMDFHREGLLLGMAAKMFVLAGPVLVYGILSGILVGFVKVFLWPLFF